MTTHDKKLLADLAEFERKLELEHPGTEHHAWLAERIRNLSYYFVVPRPWREYRDAHGVIYRY